MGYKFNPFSGNFDLAGSGGGGSSVLDGEVQFFSDLPQTVGTPPVNSAYLVRESEGTIWFGNKKQRGIYIRSGNSGVRNDDWTYGGEYPVTSVNGQVGDITLTPADIDAAEDNHSHQSSEVFADAASVTQSGGTGTHGGIYIRNGSDNSKPVYENATTRNYIWWDSDLSKWFLTSGADVNLFEKSSSDLFPWQATGAWSAVSPQAGTVEVAQATLFNVSDAAASNVIGLKTAKTGNASSTQVVLGNDTRLTNSRTPTAHAASHAAGTGSDPLFDQDLNQTDSVTFNELTVGGTVNFANAVLNDFSFNTSVSLKDNNDYIATVSVDEDNLSANRTYTLPNASGTLALTSDIPANTIASTVVDAKGDLLVGTAADTVARLAVGGTNGHVLTVDSAEASGMKWAAAASGGTKTYAVFTATDNQPPATAGTFATLDTRNSIAVLDFDDATDESAVFVSIIPEAASLGSGLKIRLHWMATTATSGNVVWDVSLERMTTDLDTDSFDTIASGTAAASGTSGILTVTEITLTTIDSVTAGDGFRLKVTRDANNASDTMTGDAEIVVCEVRSAA